VSDERSGVLATTELRIWKMLVSRYAATFPGTAGAVTTARHKVWDYLADCPLADDAALIVTELASNAALHSLSRVGTFTVRCELYSTYVWVEVEDSGGAWFRPEPDGRPHGLDIVSLLVGEHGWGIEQTSEGVRVVWARLELAAVSQLAELATVSAIARSRETAPVDPTNRAVAFCGLIDHC
jgi:anti-sigma regulatory factor (Ser/Thr protein kinase)